MFEVPAGGRRYRALELLVKQKRLNKTAPVPCVVSDAASGILMEEISFAENDERIRRIRSTSFAPSRRCATRA